MIKSEPASKSISLLNPAKNLQNKIIYSTKDGIQQQVSHENEHNSLFLLSLTCNYITFWKSI